MGSWGQEKVPTTLQGFATWRRQVSGLEAATRHDVIRHGITLDMAARSWSSNYHRNIIEHWHWNHWSPEIFPFLAAASEEWFGMMLTGTQQDLKYFEIEWGSMMLHVGTHFFPDFDCRLQIVFFLGLPRLRQCVFGMLDFSCTSQHFSALPVWSPECFEAYGLDPELQPLRVTVSQWRENQSGLAKWHDTTCWDHDKDDKAR